MCSAETRKQEAVNAGILSSMAGLLVREVWGSLEHRMKQRMHKARPWPRDCSPLASKGVRCGVSQRGL